MKAYELTHVTGVAKDTDGIRIEGKLANSPTLLMKLMREGKAVLMTQDDYELLEGAAKSAGMRCEYVDRHRA